MPGKEPSKDHKNILIKVALTPKTFSIIVLHSQNLSFKESVSKLKTEE